MRKVDNTKIKDTGSSSPKLKNVIDNIVRSIIIRLKQVTIELMSVLVVFLLVRFDVDHKTKTMRTAICYPTSSFRCIVREH